MDYKINLMFYNKTYQLRMDRTNGIIHSIMI